MSSPANNGMVFLDKDENLEETILDEEDLPDAESDGEVFDEVDDSMHVFTDYSDEAISDEAVSDEAVSDEAVSDEAISDDAISNEAISDEADDSVYLFTGHSGELYTVACSPSDATLVVTGARDHKGFLWKIGQSDWAIELQGHTNTVTSVAFSFDGQLVASGSFDGAIKVWDASSASLICTLDGPGSDVEWVRWHPRGHQILAGLKNSIVYMWDGNKNAYLLGHADIVTCGDFTPDGNKICTGSDDASLRVWDGKTGEKIHVVRGYHTKGLTCLTINADSTCVLTGSKDGSAHIVNLESGKVVSSLTSHSRSIECVGFSASGHWAATGSLDGKLIIWELPHSLARCICKHMEGVTCLSWLGASRFVATGCADWKVRIWDGLSGECVRTFRGHTHIVESIKVSADGNHLVSVALDRTARVFQIDEFR